jgi:cysteine synthase A
VLVGISSGAIIAAARQVAKTLAERHGSGLGRRVVAIVPSNGERYLSTLLFANLPELQVEI